MYFVRSRRLVPSRVIRDVKLNKANVQVYCDSIPETRDVLPDIFQQNSRLSRQAVLSASRSVKHLSSIPPRQKDRSSSRICRFPVETSTILRKKKSHHLLPVFIIFGLLFRHPLDAAKLVAGPRTFVVHDSS